MPGTCFELASTRDGPSAEGKAEPSRAATSWSSRNALWNLRPPLFYYRAAARSGRHQDAGLRLT